jgi:hypothetical protein
MKQLVNIITISWETIAFDIDLVKGLTREFDYGIYQIYGNHYAYGKDVLLYIGKAEDRNFATRLQDGGRIYSDFMETSIEPTTIRLGYISMTSKTEDYDRYNLAEYELAWKNNISIAEKILIATHPPALNKQLANRFGNMGIDQDYLIINWGDYGSLLPEVSTLRNSYMFYDFDGYYLGKDKE